jgi:hypothetical protein
MKVLGFWEDETAKAISNASGPTTAQIAHIAATTTSINGSTSAIAAAKSGKPMMRRNMGER